MPAEIVDAHAHVFRRDLPMVDGRRYTPCYDATPEAYLGELDRFGIGRALVVQPSFLGDDNSYLATVLAEHPERLRGVGVLRNPRPETIAALHDAGFRGLRLNVVGDGPPPDLAAARWQRAGGAMAALGWHLEVQARGPQWRALGAALTRWPGPVVLDHLGLPWPGDDDTVVRLAALPHVWINLSAPYRSASASLAGRIAELRAATGLARTVFGSDWPFTQHEHEQSYARVRRWAGDALRPPERDTVRRNGRRFLDGLWPARRGGVPAAVVRGPGPGAPPCRVAP